MKSNKRVSGAGIKVSGKVSPPENKTSLDDRKAPYTETRFAVVMYGGISLAIYIHGVAQELYHMVRATARKGDDETKYLHSWKKLTGTEKIYRRLGEALKTKFVVDILSGTSAGGINAIFLAKALVNDRPMELIKNFWVQEGDISRLVNDGYSVNGLSGLALQNPPLGLLNSQRFYYKLLEALMKMGSSSPDIHSPYVEELDLNITTTDIRGLNLPIKISNNTVNELRYKNVFQFYYKPKLNKKPGNDRNDFAKNMDPLLAFAARCTASIPPAFEAIQLNDISPILKTATFKSEYGDLSINEASWKAIYKEYLNEGDDFSHRSFGDGGYLDNRPFSYATEALLRRRADFPVDRRLIYIDPSPEHLEDKPLSAERPDMVQNILAALVDLPRRETIREDLKIIKERNKIIEKTNHILLNAFSYIREKKPSKQLNEWLYTIQWAKKYPMDVEVRNWYGDGYFAYHQVRIESVIENLSEAFARAIGWNEGSAEEKKIHKMLHVWLEKKYSISRKNKLTSQNDILFRLDLSFRMRRYHFLQNLLNIIIQNLAGYLQGKTPDAAAEMNKIFIASGNPLINNESLAKDDQSLHLCIQLLVELKREINDIYGYSRMSAYRLRKRGLISDTHIEKELKDYITRLRAVKAYLKKDKQKPKPEADQIEADLIEELSITLGTHPLPRTRRKSNVRPSGYLYDTYKELSARGKELGIVTIRNKDGSATQNQPAQEKLDDILRKLSPPIKIDKKRLDNCLKIYYQVQKCLAYYYDNFEYYDMLTFPVQYGTDAGESDEVEIIRVSPEDATLLVDESKSGRKKLAGTSLANFGAFFKKEWRENDMLWGRLDAAEILINQILDRVDDDGRKTVNDEVRKNFVESLKEIYKTELPSQQTEDPKEVEEFSAPDKLPYNLAFQFILEEDLRPRDKSIFHKLLGKEQETQEEDFKSVETKAKEEIPAGLQKIIEREKKMDQLEDQILGLLRNKIGAGPHPLRTHINEALKEERGKLDDKKREWMKENVERRRGKKILDALNQKSMEFLRGSLRNLEKPKKDLTAFLKTLKHRNDISYRDMMRALGRHEILNYFKYGYEVDTKFEVESSIHIADRSARVFNRLLGGLAQKYPIQKPVGILTFILQVISTLINFALPKTVSNFLFEGYWVGLAFIAEIILFAAGFLTKNDAIKNIGLVSLVVTVLTYLIVLLLNGWITRGSNISRHVLRMVKWILVTALVLSSVTIFYLGIIYLKILLGL